MFKKYKITYIHTDGSPNVVQEKLLIDINEPFFMKDSPLGQAMITGRLKTEYTDTQVKFEEIK